MKAILAIAKLVVIEIFRKKDFYVAFVLIGIILFYASGLKFYNTSNITRYLVEVGLALVFFFSVILTLPLAARQYPVELQQRTCQVLLAKPVTRAQFILGKALGSFLAGSASFTLFYFFFLLIARAKMDTLSTVVILQTFYLFLLNLLVCVAMVSALSYYTTLSANVTISLVTYFLINTYGPGLRQTSEHLFWFSRILGETFYYILPHFEFFDLRQRLIHSWGPLSWELMIFLSIYAFLYALIFFFVAWVGFRRRAL